MAQSLYKTLGLIPGTLVDVITPPALQPLTDMMPQVNESIVSPFRRGRLGLKSRYRLGRELAGRACVPYEKPAFMRFANQHRKKIPWHRQWEPAAEVFPFLDRRRRR